MEVGKMYKVKCIVWEKGIDKCIIDEDEIWRDLQPFPTMTTYEYKRITPIIDCLHHDKKFGQDYYHYHTDYRFIPDFGETTNNNGFVFHSRSRIDFINGNPQDLNYEWIWLPCVRTENLSIGGETGLEGKIVKSKSGRCPHKGYNITNEKCDKNGIITCPLHGTKIKLIK